MAYIGASPSNGVRRKHTYTATASQTTFSGAGAEGVSLSYRDSNYVDVYVNGVKLGDADYTATSGTSIVLAVGAAVSDIVEIITYDVFSVADTVSKADGGTFDGNVAMAGTLDVTGDLTVDTSTLYVDSANNRVGIGATSLSNKLTVNGDQVLLANGELKFADATNNQVGIIRNSGSSATSQLEFLTASTERMRISAIGDISFYEDTGTTPKLFWDASAESLDLKSGAELVVEETDSTNNAVRIASDVNEGFVQLYQDGSQKIQIRGNGNSYFNGGNVGIGTSSPAAQLHVSGTAPITRLTETDNLATATNARIDFYGSDARSGYVGTVGGNLSLLMQQAKPITFATSNTEAMRIDSSGNLLVGKTTPNVASVGFEAKSDGANFMTRDGGEPLKINRKTSDGNLIALAKDGTTVGTIGSSQSVTGPFFGHINVGLTMYHAGNAVLPATTTGLRDNAIDLGNSSNRFNDIYLGGGVYLGGTGSANLLDDYEEGTFAPTLAPTSSGSFALASASDTLAYTKIGRQVTITGRLAINTVSSPSGDIKITGLPFTSADLGDDAGDYTAVINFLDASAGTQVNIVTRGFDNTTELNLKRGATTVATSDQFYVNFSYFTT